jgi:hypothetical protein
VFTFYNLDLTCLLDNPVGVDYLSVASYEHMIPAHVVFLKSKVRNLTSCMKY